jgi:ATP-dependent Clp protease adapter protein ClpS
MSMLKYIIDTDYDYTPAHVVREVLETEIFDTEEEAQKFCDKLNGEADK